MSKLVERGSKRISIRSLNFCKEGDMTMLRVEYWLMTPEVEGRENGRFVVAQRFFTKNTLEVPLNNIDEGEEIYIRHLDIMDKLTPLLADYLNIDNSKEAWDAGIQTVVDEYKKNEQDSSTSTEGVSDKPVESEG